MKVLMMNHLPLDKMWLVSRMPIFIVTINSTNYILPFPPPELSTQSHLQPMDRLVVGLHGGSSLNVKVPSFSLAKGMHCLPSSH